MGAVDRGHPAFAAYQVKVSVLCKEQVHMRVQRPAPKKELLLKNLEACKFIGHDYDKETQTLKIKYQMQSPDASPNEPVCNVAYEQEFVISEACSKWTRQ